MARLKTNLRPVNLLYDAGFRIEGPGHRADRELCGRFWWTLTRDRWSGIECGVSFASKSEATDDAVSALLADEDLDWNSCSVFPHAAEQFPADFAERMRAIQRAGRGTT